MVSENALVSVVIPSYNHREYVVQAIMSVLNQCYSNIELIVIDDGSSDGSVELIASLADKYGFIFISQKNIGLTATLNKAINKYVNGEFFMVFASDDLLTPSKISVQVEFLKKHTSYGVVTGNAIRVNTEGKVLEQQYWLPACDCSFEDLFLNRFSLYAVSTLYRTEIVKSVGGYCEEVKVEDLYMLLKVARLTKVRVEDYCCAFYRIHDNNTHSDKELMLNECIKIVNMFSDHPLYIKALCRWRLNFFLVMLLQFNLSAVRLLPYLLKNFLNLNLSEFLKDVCKRRKRGVRIGRSYQDELDELIKSSDDEVS